MVVINPFVRRGLLMLQPRNIQVLGGCVDVLEAARKKGCAAWQQPAGEGLEDGGLIIMVLGVYKCYITTWYYVPDMFLVCY